MSRGLLIFILLASIQGYGQETMVQPEFFEQFHKTWFLINPATIGSEGRLQANVGNKSYTGLFQGVRTFYGHLHYSFINKEKNKKSRYHTIGLTFLNNKEGDFFNRSKVFLPYSYHIKISNEYTLSAGLSAGMVNYLFKGSAASGGGSSIAFTGDLGLYLYSDKGFFGFSLNQFPKGKLQPIEEVYVLSRQANVHLGKKILFSENSSFNLASLISYSNVNKFEAKLSGEILMAKILSGGVIIDTKRGYSVLAGVNNIPLGNSAFNLNFSYFIPFNKSVALRVNLFEVSAQYHLKD